MSQQSGGKAHLRTEGPEGGVDAEVGGRLDLPRRPRRRLARRRHAPGGEVVHLSSIVTVLGGLGGEGSLGGGSNVMEADRQSVTCVVVVGFYLREDAEAQAGT